MSKDWASILNGYSSGEDSDAHDEPNVMSLQKNAPRVAELLHAFVPGLDDEDVRRPPMGMNQPDVIRNGLADLLAVPADRKLVASRKHEDGKQTRPQRRATSEPNTANKA